MKCPGCILAVSIAALALLAVAPARGQTAQPAAPAAQQAPKAQQPQDAAKDKTAPAAAPAQPAGPPAPPPPDLARAQDELEKANAALNDVEAGLERHDLSDADLVAKRQRLAPIGDVLNATAEKIAPRLGEIKARLDQLGLPPDEKSPPENQSVTEERAAQQQSYNNADELLKRAKLLSVRTEQLRTSVASRRRALFTRSLFQRSSSIADARLWRDVLPETPKNAEGVVTLFTDWAGRINDRFDGWRLAAFWLCLPAVFLIYIPLARLARRVLARRDTVEKPSRLLKIFGAWWIALVIALPPIALIYLVVFSLDAANLTSFRIQTVFMAIAGAVARVCVAAGLARGLFAPTRPNWRLPPISDAAASRIVSVAVSVAAIVSITRICEALNEVVDASFSFSVATRGLGVAIGAAALGMGLWRTGADVSDEDCFGPPVTRRLNWFSILRGVALIGAVVAGGAVLAGYPTFASFFLDQLLWVSAIAALYFLASVLIDESITAGFKPGARLGDWLTTRVGVRRNSLELLGVVLSGVLRVSLFIIGLIAILAPWGLQSTDVPLDLRAAFFGFKVAEVTISPVAIFGAAVIFALVSATVHALQRWLDSSLLPKTNLDSGLRNSIITSLGYLGFLLSAGVALSYLGLSFERLAIVAGALSVGIGFGLQSIVNNFVSGLILLWERAVRVGDWIVVGGDQGFVRRINVRSTEIETVDRSQVIIPNSSLISGVVKNLVRNDRSGRVLIEVAVNASANPEEVREVLFATAKANDRVLKIPAPQIYFTGMSGATLNFELAAFVADVETMARVRSDLHFAIFKEFRAHKFFDGPDAGPQKIEIVGAAAQSLSPRAPAQTDADNARAAG
ncbi:MscS Mechanosensitive ion channel [Methylocella silvestris BL2]|uniref:MscS Mechanosensitive ion channel n=1 Tax=Methylocella silvestris (strain DSM 15510 / CIP 108128 / LMG 27833 / NCIMB 13906 / BL2) TaxID=395965 RepID=B8EJM2_METSB|nr:MscS Mechanosensitive ion channel [Methylocella silvestris BL2]